MRTKHHSTDLTQQPDLATRHGTGSKRSQKPLYLDRLPPCNHACPAGENIQGWLALAQASKFEEAWQLLMRDNPLPAVHGRVCYHPCETSCNRQELDQTVSIHAIERFLGDKAIAEGWLPKLEIPKTGKRVLVVGAGPSGLSAAYHLTRLGHAVEIYEAGPLAGGMMHFGIPKYRLPRPILDAEITRLEKLGIAIFLNRKVTDLLAEKTAGAFEAVFVAVGAHLSKRTEIPSRDAGAIYDALAFLKQVEVGKAPKIGRRVAIYGGGNTALDAARTAKRLGASETVIIYRRDRDHMPAHSFELDEALEEGIKVHWLRTIKSLDSSQLEVEIMRLDEKGKPQPTGEFETLAADSLIMALGQDVDTDFLRRVPGIQFKDDGVVNISPLMMTGHPGIFAGGDMVPSERTVTIAVGHGKKAARNIDAYLRGSSTAATEKKNPVNFNALHVWYFTDAAQRGENKIDLATRQAGFSEVVRGLSEAEAKFEASRCLSCGNCFECDGCYAACPEDAIIKLGAGQRYRYDYNLCTGCAVCFEQCPCAAIQMVPERS